MRLIGGVVFQDGGRDAPVGLVRAMAQRVDGLGEPVCAGDGSVALFGTGRVTVVATNDIWLAADLDLTGAETQPPTGESVRAAEWLESLYRTYGIDLVERLRGAFALVVWDRRLRRLSLAVDHVGIKRLYYVTTREGFAFSSRISALLAVPGTALTVDPTAVYHYFNFGFVPAPHAIFTGVRRLPAGHRLLWDHAEPVVTRYWDLVYRERPIGVREAATATFHMVEEAVAASLSGAAPKETGAFLSGGTDSSTVVGLMSKATAEAVHAFSIGFREPRYDELRYARLAARHFGAEHETETLTAEAALKLLPSLVQAHDEPFGNDSSLATYACAQLARDHGMVRLLAGDGGDELFGGNERYRINQIFAAYGWVPATVRRGLLEPVLSRLPASSPPPIGRAQRYVRRANLPTARRFYSSEFFVAQQWPWLLTSQFAGAVDLDDSWKLVEQHFDRVEATSELSRLLYVDLKLTIADNDLLKVTRAAELAGIDVRFPLLDHRLAQFTGMLPASYKVRGFEKRYVFKRAFRHFLPAATLAKRKHGFGVPVSDWLRLHPGFRELMHDVLLSRDARIGLYMRPEGLGELARLHARDETSYYGSLLWMFLMFELWYREHVDGKTPA